MTGRRPWRELRDAVVTPEAQAHAAQWVAARCDPAFLDREHKAATLLDGALDATAYADARRVVRVGLGLDPDAVPHDAPPGWCPTTSETLAGER